MEIQKNKRGLRPRSWAKSLDKRIASYYTSSGLSYREIAKLVGKSHMYVKRVIDKKKGAVA
jgi:transposase